MSIADIVLRYNSINDENRSDDFVALIALIIIGLIMISFRSNLFLDDKSRVVIKESGLLRIRLSREKVNIPKKCDGIIIKQKRKTGTGHFRFVLPVSYNFKSFDMFFHSKTGLVRLINTDYKSAIKIAEFFKSNYNLEYTLEK